MAPSPRLLGKPLSHLSPLRLPQCIASGGILTCNEEDLPTRLGDGLLSSDEGVGWAQTIVVLRTYFDFSAR